MCRAFYSPNSETETRLELEQAFWVITPWLKIDISVQGLWAHNHQAFFNTTWEVRRGKILPGLEFFPWVLSFLLEFWVFPWVFRIVLNLFCNILINFDIFPLEFNFSKIFVNKNAIKSPTPSKMLSFDRKIKFFSWIFLIGGKILPEVEFFPWVFGLSFFLEF